MTTQPRDAPTPEPPDSMPGMLARAVGVVILLVILAGYVIGAAG